MELGGKHGKIINKHSKKIISINNIYNSSNNNNIISWNCRNKAKRPLENNCLINNIIHKSMVKTFI